jgi:hypothetical protein
MTLSLDYVQRGRGFGVQNGYVCLSVAPACQYCRRLHKFLELRSSWYSNVLCNSVFVRSARFDALVQYCSFYESCHFRVTCAFATPKG